MNRNVDRELAILSDVDGDNRALISAMIRLAEYSNQDRTDEVLASLKRLLNHPSAEIRRYAAITLGKLGTIEALPSLVTLCADAEIQGAALHALRLIASTMMINVATEALRNGNGEARREALLVLGESGVVDDEALGMLRRAAENGDDLSIRMARRTLERLSEKR